MDPRFNGPPGGGGFNPNGPFPPGYGGPVVHRMMGGEHLIAGIVFLLLVVLVLALLFFLLYRLLRQHPSGAWAPHLAAIRELEMRYARGEIGRDDFLQRRADLLAPAAAANLPPAPPPTGGEPPTPTARTAGAGST